MIKVDKEVKQIRVAVYLRVSTEDQVEKFGLDMQRDAILAFIKSKGQFEDGRDRMVLAGEDHIYIDDGVSGTFDIPDRKDFRRLIENIKYAPKNAKPFDAVAVYKVDRLARRLAILLNIIGIFDKYEIEFVSVNESIDTSTPFGRAILGIMGVIAELEIETTRMRTSGGRIAAKLRGKYGATPPYGYRKNNLGFLEVLEDEAKHVRDMFSWCVFESKTTHEIGKLLSNQKVVSPEISTFRQKKKKGESRKINNDYFWRNETVKGILSNEIYIGNFWFGKTKDRKPVPKDNWQLSEMKIPAIIEESVFNVAQKRLQDSVNKTLLNGKREEDRLYLLSGLIKCGWCQKHSRTRQANTWNGNKKELTKGSGEYSYYYKCGHKNDSKYDQLCPTIPIPAEQLESYVIAFLKGLLSNPRIAFEHQRRLKSSQLQIRQLRQERSDVIKKINDIPRRRKNLSFQHENTLITNDVLLLRDKEIVREDRDLNTRLRDINKILGEQVLSDGYVKSFAEYSKRYSKALEDIGNNEDEIYTLTHSLIDEIIVYSRAFDARWDKIAGRRKDNQQIPNSILIKLKLPKDLLNELINQQISHLTKFAVRTDTM